MITKCNEVKICKRSGRLVKEGFVVDGAPSVKQVTLDIAVKGDLDARELYKELRKFCSTHGVAMAGDYVGIEDVTAPYEEYLDDLIEEI